MGPSATFENILTETTLPQTVRRYLILSGWAFYALGFFVPGSMNLIAGKAGALAGYLAVGLASLVVRRLIIDSLSIITYEFTGTPLWRLVFWPLLWPLIVPFSLLGWSAHRLRV